MQDKERTGKQRKKQKRKTEKEFQGERDLGYKRGILCALQWGRNTREVPEDWLRSSLLYQPPAPLPCKPTGQDGRGDCLVFDAAFWRHCPEPILSQLQFLNCLRRVFLTCLACNTVRTCPHTLAAFQKHGTLKD